MNQELKDKSVDEIKALIKKKDFQIALIKINKLIKFHPTYLYLYGLRGEILFLKKRYDDAYDDTDDHNFRKKDRYNAAGPALDAGVAPDCRFVGVGFYIP